MSANKNNEIRSIGELRSSNDTGEFEGYITTWDSVDSYDSTFIKGAFSRTIAERGSKIKVFYNHTDLIGRVIDIREDDHGVFVRGQVNLESDRGKEVHSFMKDGTLEGLSFGFRTVRQTFSKGITEIREVKLFEFGPVIFPANDTAEITDVRANTFEQSLSDEALDSENYNLKYALTSTLNEVWWESSADEIIGKLDVVLSDHRAAYLDYASRYVAQHWLDEAVRSNPFQNNLSTVFGDYLKRENKDIKDIAANSSFNIDQLDQLKRGEIIEAREHLLDLSSEILEAHQAERNAKIESLCIELRGGLTNSEKTRINALLTLTTEARNMDDSGISDLLNYFKTENTKV